MNGIYFMYFAYGAFSIFLIVAYFSISSYFKARKANFDCSICKDWTCTYHQCKRFCEDRNKTNK